ncbi:ATP-binding protein [Pseudomonas chlororaphis]|uniref:ATP-binding protein n=1 Tax=Pseudomonas chlororaphis TaxID=587753 RepID=UPI0006A57700|nr:ATP-binding protein [Pseudomonas chlororaphis]
MPASIISDDHYFLPLSPETAEQLEQNHDDLASLQVPELAAVLLIQNLPALVRAGQTAPRIEAALAKALIAGLESDAEHGSHIFGQAVAERFSPVAFKEGLGLLDGLMFNLLEVDEVAERKYLKPDGSWDFSFRIEHAAQLNPLKEAIATESGQTIFLTTPQFRIFKTLRSELDEHLHLQGLAGVGKTSMISTLLEYLKPENTLLLAHTSQQLRALTVRLGSKKFIGMTFGQLASHLLFTPPTVYRKPDRQRYQPTYQMSDEDVARVLSFQSVGSFSPKRVAEICRRIVQSFCYSSSGEITAENIPLVDRSLSDADRAVLLGYSNLMWQEVTRPHLLFEGRKTHLPIRVYHLLKLLSLDTGISLSLAEYRHIVIDEAHDLPTPLMQFLDRCPQATCTLGDVCQRLDGLPAQRGKHVRQREISQSVRSGRQMEVILNPLIAAHPRAQLAPLVGARDKKTIIEYYDRSDIPENGTTILAKGEWGLFEWFQRLASANASFCMLPESEKQFRRFVNDCIELYHHGSPPKHAALFRHSTWESLAATYANNYSFKTIEAMLERGYSSNDFERSMEKMDRTGCTQILLGRVSDVRSLELDKVMLGRDLLSPIRTGDVDEAAKVFAGLYTGSSRARYKLIVPGHMQDWMVDQAAKVKK